MGRLSFRRLKWVLILFLFILLLPLSAAAQSEYNLFPDEAEPGAAELQLTLTGPDLGSFGELTDVVLRDEPIESFDEGIDDETRWVFVWIPEDFPAGQHIITFVFQETSIRFPFTILGEIDEPFPDEPLPPSFDDVTPREGEINTDVELRLFGENLAGLGEPVRVEIGGVALDFWDFAAEDANTLRIWIFISENVPLGDNEISFIFEQAAFDAYFFVFETVVPPDPDDGGQEDPTPFQPREDPGEFPWGPVIVGAVVGGGLVVVVGGGMLLRRIIKKPEPKDDPRPGGPKKLEFRHHKDAGEQKIFPQDKPISLDGEFRIDKHLEHIDTSIDQSSSIIDGDDDNAGGMT